MKLLAAILLIAPCMAGQALPNPRLTPGAVNPALTAKKLCSRTFTTRDERHTTPKMKREVCREYGVANCPHARTMEIDHLVSLELGGADSEGNLWPQMAPDFHAKDKLENKLHALVCANKLALPDAQACIRDDWWKCGKRIGLWK